MCDDIDENYLNRCSPNHSFANNGCNQISPMMPKNTFSLENENYELNKL